MSKELRTWLNELGLEKYADCFEDHDIDMDVLPDLSDRDLADIGVSLGHRKRILKSIASSCPQKALRDSTRATTQIETAHAEQRQLTVMFCDLVGSTALSVRYDRDDLRKIIIAFQECCSEVIADSGGNIGRSMGDGLLVYFGYPVASEYDPEKAIRAGLEVVNAVSALEVLPGLKLETRVGVATGEVIAGDVIQSGLTLERTVMGATPNLAARLQSHAAPDTVVVSDQTRRLAGGLFEYEDLGLLTLSGFDEPVHAWGVKREAIVESRFEATHAYISLTHVVGRDSELDLLNRVKDRSIDGRGHAVLLKGEPGIGKSRMTIAIRNAFAKLPHTLLRYYCTPYQQNSALISVIGQLERAAGFSADDDPGTRLRKLERSLQRHTGVEPDIVPLYATLLSLPTEDSYAPLNLSPRLFRDSIFRCVLSQLEDLARDAPVLMIFEDLHWVDPTTRQLLGLIVDRIRTLPVMLVMTARPEFESSWPESACTPLELQRLTAHESRAVVERVCGGKSLPQEVLEQIIVKSDGIPLFVEELTKTVIASGLLAESDEEYFLTEAAPEISIPNTLQDSLMARLDQLSEAKEVAQIGAAIGREFSYEFLAAICSLDRGELIRALGQLITAQLITGRGEPPESTYEFRHALIRDAAYFTMLREQRRELHREVAAQIERKVSETGQVRPALLAHHYTQSGDTLTAIHYWLDAGKLAKERAAHLEAVRHLNTALGMLSDVPDDRTRLQLELELQIALGPNLEATFGYSAEQVEETYKRAHELSEQLGQTTELVPILLGLYVFHLVRGELGAARSLAEQCVRLAEDGDQVDYLIEACAALGFSLCYSGEFEQSRLVLERCVSLYEAHGDDKFVPVTAQHPAVASLALLPLVLWQLGLPDRSADCLGTAFSLAERLEHPINFALIHTHAAQLYQVWGEPEKALEHAQLGMQIAAEHGYDIWHLACTMHLGIAKSTLGETAEGIPLVENGLNAWLSAGAAINKSYYLAGIAEAEREAERPRQSLELLDQAFESIHSNGEYYFESYIRHIRGLTNLACDPPRTADAQADFEEAIRLARAHGASMIEIRATNSLVGLLLAQNRGAELAAARQSLHTLYSGFAEGLQTPDLLEAERHISQPRPAAD